MRTRLVRLILLLLLVCLLAVPAFAVDIKVQPGDDYVYFHWHGGGSGNYYYPNESPNYSYYNGWGPPWYVENAYSGMAFDISTLSGEVVESAFLNLYLTNVYGDYGSGAGVLQHGSSYVDTIEGSTALGWNAWDVTSFVTADNVNGSSAYVMNFVGYPNVGSSGVVFNSGETPDYAPFLRVKYTGEPAPVAPEPVSSALFLLGGATMAMKKYRKNKKA